MTDTIETKQTPLDHLRSQKQPIFRSVRIATDNEAVMHLGELGKDIERLRRKQQSADAATDLAREIESLQETVESLESRVFETSIKFVFRALGRKKYENLVNSCPPTEAQQEEVEKQAEDGSGASLSWNPETFPIELMARSLVEPDLGYAEAKEYFAGDDLNSAEYEALFLTAIAANTARRVVELGKG